MNASNDGQQLILKCIYGATKQFRHHTPFLCTFWEFSTHEIIKFVFRIRLNIKLPLRFGISMCRDSFHKSARQRILTGNSCESSFLDNKGQ